MAVRCSAGALVFEAGPGLLTALTGVAKCLGLPWTAEMWSWRATMLMNLSSQLGQGVRMTPWSRSTWT